MVFSGLEKYSTLRTAYSAFFDDVAPASVTAQPMLGAAQQYYADAGAGTLVQHAPVAPATGAATTTTHVHRAGVMATTVGDDVHIVLSTVEFGAVCAAAGLAVGMLLALLMMKK
jgi:hypothetical protein